MNRNETILVMVLLWVSGMFCLLTPDLFFKALFFIAMLLLMNLLYEDTKPIQEDEK